MGGARFLMYGGKLLKPVYSLLMIVCGKCVCVCVLLIGLIACFHASALVFYSFSAASDVRLMNFGVEMVSGIVPSIFIFISLFFNPHYSSLTYKSNYFPVKPCQSL